MNKKGKTDMGTILLAVGVIALITGVIKINLPGDSQQQSAFETGEQATSSSGVGYATAITAGAINKITGATLDVNTDMFASDYSWASGEVQTNALPTSISTTAPNSMVGFAMLGNDANQGTDRGTEVYRRKIPFSYAETGAYKLKDTDDATWIKLYAESTPTWTGYDDGTAESTLNVTIGSGGKVTTTELKFAAGSQAALGNPAVDNPLGVCFNVSTLSEWEEIRPANYVGKFDSCEVHDAYNILGKCYILPTSAVMDDGFYRFYIILEAASGQNPDTSDYAHAFLMDKTYYLNDEQKWELGWCDDSVDGTDYDPGIAALGNEKKINFT